jgi:hypothetical protein
MSRVLYTAIEEADGCPPLSLGCHASSVLPGGQLTRQTLKFALFDLWFGGRAAVAASLLAGRKAYDSGADLLSQGKPGLALAM